VINIYVWSFGREGKTRQRRSLGRQKYYYVRSSHERIWHRRLGALQLLRDTRRLAHKTVDVRATGQENDIAFSVSSRGDRIVFFFFLFFISTWRKNETPENPHRDAHRWPMTRPNDRVYINQDYTHTRRTVSSSHTHSFSVSLCLWIIRCPFPPHFTFGDLCGFTGSL